MGSAQSATGVGISSGSDPSLPLSAVGEGFRGTRAGGASEADRENDKPKKPAGTAPAGTTGVGVDVDRRCRKHKRAWGRCVADHYEKKFLPGKSLEPEQDCDDFFEKFRDCYMRGMLVQRRQKGLPPPKKDSALHEYMVDEGMTDDGE